MLELPEGKTVDTLSDEIAKKILNDLYAKARLENILEKIEKDDGTMYSLMLHDITEIIYWGLEEYEK